MLNNTLIKNSLYNSLSWGANVVLNLVSVPIIVHYLGAEGFGIYALLTGLFGYFALLDLGSGQGLIKCVAEHSGLNDHDSIKNFINAAIFFQLAIAIPGLLTLLWFNGEIISLLKVGSSYVDEARVSLYISSIGFLLTMVLGNYSSALQGLQRFAIIGKTNMIFSIITAAAIIVVLVAGGGLTEIIFVSVVLSVANSFVFVVVLKKYLPEYGFSIVVKYDYIKTLFTYSGYLFISRTANFLNNTFLRFIVSAFWGPNAVAFFVAPMKLVSTINGGLGSLAGVLFPYASEMAARGSSVELNRVYVKASKYLATLGMPLFLFMIFFSREILTFWMGYDFSQNAWTVASIVSGAWLLSSFTIVPTNAVLGMGHSRAVAWFSIGVAVLNLSFCFWLTAVWGVTGAATSILITQIMAFPFIWYATEKLLKISWNTYVKEVFAANYIPSCVFIIAAIACNFIVAQINIPNQAVISYGFGLIAVYLFLVERSGAISISDLRNLFTQKR
jgi:O-antigen/teichoic acid export membrane protein